MIEQDAVRSEETIRLTIVDGNVVGISLSATVGRAGMKRSIFGLWYFTSFAEKLRGRGLIEFGADTSVPYRLKQAHCAQTSYLTGVLGHVKTYSNMRLRAKIVYFLWLSAPQNGVQGTVVSIDGFHRSRFDLSEADGGTLQLLPIGEHRFFPKNSYQQLAGKHGRRMVLLNQIPHITKRQAHEFIDLLYVKSKGLFI